MAEDAVDRTMRWVVIGSLVTFLASLLALLALGLDTYTVLWLAVLAVSVIGMTALMTLVIRVSEGGAENGPPA